MNVKKNSGGPQACTGKTKPTDSSCSKTKVFEQSKVLDASYTFVYSLSAKVSATQREFPVPEK